MRLYSLYDHKAQTFTPPMLFENDDIAVREIIAIIANSPTIPPAKYPGDFSLFAVAYWDNNDAVFPLENGKYCVENILTLMTSAASRDKEMAKHFEQFYVEKENNG